MISFSNSYVRLELEVLQKGKLHAVEAVLDEDSNEESFTVLVTRLLHANPTHSDACSQVNLWNMISETLQKPNT